MRKKSLKEILGVLFVFFLAVCLEGPAFAQLASCSTGTWTQTSVDTWNQTKYTLSAPCVVKVGEPFAVIATATDTTWPNTLVGGSWSIQDNGIILADGTVIYGINTDASGSWVGMPTQTYTSAGEHTISFTYRDFGNGWGGMQWDPYVTLSGITVAVPANSAPIVEAGDNIWLHSQDQIITTITGTATDPEDNALTYRWLEVVTDGTSTTTIELTPGPQPVDDGKTPLYLASIPPMQIGSHTLILEVSDGTLTSTDDVIVTIENSSPTCQIMSPADRAVYYLGQDMPLTGQVYDYDGDRLQYTWFEGSGNWLWGSVIAMQPDLVTDITFTFPGGLAPGHHIVTLKVEDLATGQICLQSVEIDVENYAAIALAPVPSKSILWPPNGELTTVTINANALDYAGGQVMLNALVSSNEPSTDKDGNPDFSITNIDQATGVITSQLRAARTGGGGDRLYAVTVEGKDQSGNSSKSVVTIKAPHDNGRR